MKIKLPDNERAIWILKTKGPQPLNILAQEMNVTTEGARFQLLKLASDGLVYSTTESKGRGRPQQIWSLSSLGNSRFPDTHAELTVKLIQKTREILGEEALQTIIDANGQEGKLRYNNAIEGITDLETKIKTLANLRDQEGYMAGYIKDEEGFLLIENHCPICAAATICQGFCKSELEIFQSVLGDNVKINRVDHILAGSRRCAYRITNNTI